MKKVIEKTVIILAFVTAFISCNKDKNLEMLTPDFNEISNLATFHGNKNSNIIIINTQGGPGTKLDDDELKEIIKESSINNKALVVNVHQIQTKKPALFIKNDISFEAAKSFDKTSVKGLKTVIDFFKKLPNKKVYVLGISFGAFMTQDLIASYGINVADGYLISVGRLDIDDKTWKPFSKGIYTKYIYDSVGKYTIKEIPTNDIKKKNMAKLAAGLGYNRYSVKFLKIKDLSKITYVYGDRDEQVGPLSSAEINFLKNRKATIVLEPKGNHEKAIKKTASILKQVFNIK